MMGYPSFLPVLRSERSEVGNVKVKRPRPLVPFLLLLYILTSLSDPSIPYGV